MPKDILNEINKKLDMMMEHIGCKKMSEEEYMGMSEDEKDAKDEQDMMDKREEE